MSTKPEFSRQELEEWYWEEVWQRDVTEELMRRGESTIERWCDPMTGLWHLHKPLAEIVAFHNFVIDCLTEDLEA